MKMPNKTTQTLSKRALYFTVVASLSALLYISMGRVINDKKKNQTESTQSLSSLDLANQAIATSAAQD